MKFKRRLDTVKLFIVCSLVSLQGHSVVRANSEALSAADVMTFSDSFACNDTFPHHSFCEAVEFKAWSQEEKALVTKYLKNIKDPRLHGILEKIKEKGIKQLHRVSSGATWFPNSALRRVEFVKSSDLAILWVNPVTRVIGFTDSFFNGTEFMDPYAGHSRKQLNVLHELMHVYDMATDHTASGSAFQVAAKWSWNGRNHMIENIDYDKAMAQFAECLRLVKNKQTTQAYALDREHGRTYGFPTLYGMTNAHESFAEAMTYFIFDASAPSYYSMELQEYLNSLLTLETPSK